MVCREVFHNQCLHFHLASRGWIEWSQLNTSLGTRQSLSDSICAWRHGKQDHLCVWACLYISVNCADMHCAGQAKKHRKPQFGVLIQSALSEPGFELRSSFASIRKRAAAMLNSLLFKNTNNILRGDLKCCTRSEGGARVVLSSYHNALRLRVTGVCTHDSCSAAARPAVFRCSNSCSILLQ